MTCANGVYYGMRVMRGEYFVDFIARNPEAGLSETGEGFAKFGGAGEVQATSAAVLGSSIFFHDLNTTVYLLLVYAKAVRTDISPDAKKAVREFAERIK
jgi:hypothetical protein